MDLFDRFRRRQTNRRKPASRRDQRQLCVETLESRVLLAAAPAIFVITHGFQFSTSDNASLPQWSADVENAINSVLQKSYPDLQKDFVTENWATVSDQIGPYGRDFAAQDIESKIDRMMTEHNWIQADLFFVGHSRGAIVNTQVIQELGSDARFDRIEMVMLDPTAALPMLDNLVNPALVPSSVDRARNYDDGHPLAPPLTYDGFSLHAEQSNTVIVSSDVGDIIDSYIGEASVLDYFLREPAAIAASRILSTLAFGTDKPIQALAAGNEYRHSYKSHSAIDDW